MKSKLNSKYMKYMKTQYISLLTLALLGMVVSCSSSGGSDPGGGDPTTDITFSTANNSSLTADITFSLSKGTSEYFFYIDQTAAELTSLSLAENANSSLSPDISTARATPLFDAGDVRR